ncbi:MAG: RsmB/NOP family class I SAM-dependent RNA methyltransferase [Candidatus Nanoarchaeia archaeon]|nr:RsmB/NOP family class I SAM-dependent RNA methyltransferase [Candidatus Nanoarchaeia archaeon]
MDKLKFVEQMKNFDNNFSIEFLDLINSRFFIRINTLKISENNMLKIFDKKNIKYVKTNVELCYEILESEFNVVSMVEYLLGYFYIQDYGSQLIPYLLEPKENDLILDMASAPGSKTTQIAQMTNNKSKIVALELNFERISKLESNIDRLNIDNLVVLNIDAKDFLNDDIFSDNKMEFDKILLDAPCSGNYLIEEDWFFKRSEDDINEVAYVQSKLLNNAFNLLKKGGILVYSTCTMNIEENEFLINDFLTRFNSEVEIINCNDSYKNSFSYDNFIDKYKLNKKIKNCIRILPTNDSFKPFFICKIKKI